MATGALQSIIFARVFVCEWLCACALFVLNSEMFVFLCPVFSLCVSVFVLRVCAPCVCVRVLPHFINTL